MPSDGTWLTQSRLCTDTPSEGNARGQDQEQNVDGFLQQADQQEDQSDAAASEPEVWTEGDLFLYEQHKDTSERVEMEDLQRRITKLTPWREGVALVPTTEAQQSGTNVILLDSGHLAVHSTAAIYGWPWNQFGRPNEPFAASLLYSEPIYDSCLQSEFKTAVFVQQVHPNSHIPLIGVSGV